MCHERYDARYLVSSYLNPATRQAVLAQGGVQLSIIDNDPDVIRDAERYGFKVYYGDGARSDVLHAAGAHHARVIMVCVNNKDAATRITENVKHECPHSHLVVRAYDRRHAVELVKHEADEVIRETFESALLMGRRATQALGASEAEADLLIDTLRARDAERFALETTGGDFAGRDLLLRNVEPRHAPDTAAAASSTS